MKSRTLFILSFVLLTLNTTYAQDVTVGLSYARTSVDTDFDVNKVYYKGTETKVPKKKFYQLVRENPNLYLEKEFDDAGNVVRYTYDSQNQNAGKTLFRNKSIPAKSNFPNFKLTTIDGKKIELAELNGKLVILRFELYANDFRFKKHEIRELDDKINALPNKQDVAAIVIFQGSTKNVRKGFDLSNSNFEVVANGQNFIDKYGVSRFPSTLLIDQNGTLIEKYSYSEDIVLEDHLKK